MGLLENMGRWLGRPGSEEREARAAAMREEHLRRCHNFKLLVQANNRALETMADMEECLAGGRVYGMAAVRAMCTRTASEVFRMVRCLCEIAPGRYETLQDRFKDIQSLVDDVIVVPAGAPAGGAMALSINGMGLEDVDEVGGKMAALGQVRRMGLAVPEGFAVTATAFRRFMAADGLQEEIDRRIQQSGLGAADNGRSHRLDQVYALSSDLQRLVMSAPVVDEVRRALEDGVRAMTNVLGPGLRLAVRSSAVGEDALGASFAGQYRSELGVPPEEAVSAWAEVVAAKYGVTAMSYRLARGIRDEDVPMSVGVLRMVDAAVSGVSYSRDPIDFHAPRVLLRAVPGLPKGVVDGSVDSDAFVVERGSPMRIVSRRVPAKDSACFLDHERGVREVRLDAGQGAAPCLDDGRILEVAGLAVRLEEGFGRPQDVEWALDRQGVLWVLQSRALAAAENTEPTEDGAPLPPGVDESSVLLRGGETASPGAASAEAFVVAKDADALRFPDWAVLVADQALPRWAPLLPRAAAVVTAHGSLAGHLANVAREYGLPALLGVPGAVEALAGAGLVTVDAERRVVCRGEVPQLLAGRSRPADPMLGSPVHEALGQVAGYVVPLNLLDPDDPGFAPGNCRTLHDITRYCHERAVAEMFETGRDGGLARHFARRLVVDVPMQYWVIDLGGGLRTDSDAKVVALEEVESGPMMALWRGMTTVPWAGPPAPPDVGSFLSVLAQSASNPDLDPAMASGFSARNYFMVSHDFCSLQARFGYHFCTVEALVGNEPEANYASFRFKGGAADLERRVRRAHFVEDLLDGYGFRCEVRQDSLVARMEGRDRKTMEDGLAVLGHMVVHTRQLDLVMNDEGERMRRFQGIVADIALGLGVAYGKARKQTVAQSPDPHGSA